MHHFIIYVPIASANSIRKAAADAGAGKLAITIAAHFLPAEQDASDR